MPRRTASVVLALLSLLPAGAAAQDAALDVLDGETLYEGGWLISAGLEAEDRDELRSGWSRIPDPLDQRAEIRDTTLGVHYGLRNDLQLSLLVPRVDRTLHVRSPSGSGTLRGEGLGDVVALAKWRYHRWDAPHKAFNNALIFGLELPTGEDDVTDGTLRLPAEYQPGRGSWNPVIGLASTYEPGRWRFNAVALYTHGGGGGEQETGNSLFAELAVGNRFWLEPYPGPFMRADLALRYRRDERIHVTDDLVTAGAGSSSIPGVFNDPNEQPSGGELTSVALNWAFRPRPSLDFQVELETPISQYVDGEDLGSETTLALRFGYRF